VTLEDDAGQPVARHLPRDRQNRFPPPPVRPENRQIGGTRVSFGGGIISATPRFAVQASVFVMRTL